jgi:very-short-patch-repair endonuclease
MKLKPLAKEKRSLPTVAEAALWQALRAHRFGGVKFRRQHVIGRFIVDFYCSKANLTIELDGQIHEYSRDEDQERQAFLEELGLRVIRFSNDAVLNNLNEVLRVIGEALETSPPAAATPSPPCGEGDPTK